MSDRLAEAADRFRLAFDLYEAGEAMMREKLRREHPGASDREIEELLVAWLEHRPGAEAGDSAGTPIAWPRPAK